MSTLKKHHRLLLQLILFSILSLVLVSCETVRFYEQAARGQLGILFNRQKIEEVLAADETPQQLKEKLSAVLAIRSFAEQDLNLPTGGSYLAYVQLGREHVLWNVFAAPEFSLEPINWCYPIAGCVSYRGYFSESDAIRFAEQLAVDGYDVYTGGVDAYSTLGWFDDPLFSTVINRPHYQLAGLIFHELAHQLVYVSGDTTFNESFATLVEREGIRRWLSSQSDSPVVQQAEQDAIRQTQFIQLVVDYRQRFEELFASTVPVEEMRARKAEMQQSMRLSYQELKQQWQGSGGYDRWFENSLNNAQLSTVSSYNDLVPAFASLLASHEGNLSEFYAAVQELASLESEARSTELEQLVPMR